MMSTIQSLILHFKLWLAKREHAELMNEWIALYGGSDAHCKMVAAGERINRLKDQLEAL